MDKEGAGVFTAERICFELFYLGRYLIAALGRDSDAHKEIWAAFKEGDQVRVEKVLREVARQAETPGRKEAVWDCRRYIRQNWDGIMAYRLYPEAQLGVSAEAHVSHLYAARLSSWPMAWSVSLGRPDGAVAGREGEWCFLAGAVCSPVSRGTQTFHDLQDCRRPGVAKAKEGGR